MKNKLYIFGCSFAWSIQDTRTWPYKLAEHYNLELVNTSFPCYGILHHFNEWKKVEKNMKPGDMVVVCVSSPDRTFFFPDAPWFTQLRHTDTPQLNGKIDKIEPAFDKKIVKQLSNAKSAFINYFKYLHNTSHSLWFLECWLRWLDVKSKELGTKTVVIPAFKEIVPSLDGDFKNLLIFKNDILMDISLREYGDKKYSEIFTSHLDLRANHLCFSNHDVLVSKIITAIDLGYISPTKINWHEGIINDKNVFNKNWREKELCPAKFDETFFYKENFFDKIVKRMEGGNFDSTVE